MTLLVLFAFVGGTIAYWTVVRWLLDRTGLLRRTVAVTVDGKEWDEVDTLDDAGPEDKVYSLDPSTGTVEFGDGVHGKVPVGAVSATTRNRYRAGAVGAVAAASAVWVAGTWRVRKRWRGRCGQPAFRRTDNSTSP
jgi:hypothetical protein